MALGLKGTSLFSDANLLAYYELENGALTTDSKGSNTLTNNNTVGSDTGKFGGAADFGTANTNKYLSRADTLGVANSNTAVSFAGWVKLNTEITAGNAWQLSAMTFVTNNVYYIFIYDFGGASRKLQFQRVRGGVIAQGYDHTVTMGTTDWHHIALTWDTSTLRAYFDGTEVGNTAASGNGSGSGSANAFSIGAYVNGGSASSIDVDDFAVFNKALSAAEVTTLYNAPTSEASGGFYYMSS